MEGNGQKQLWKICRTTRVCYKKTPAYLDLALTETPKGTTCSRTSKQQSIVNFIIYLQYEVMPIYQKEIILPKPFRFRKSRFLISRTTENLFIMSVFGG